jgi:hypothetical protein
MIRFQPNAMQRRYRAAKAKIAQSGAPARHLLLKHRQWGGTTEEQAQTLYLTSCIPGNWAATIAPIDKTSELIFQMALTMYGGIASEADRNGDPLLCFKRKTENKRQLDFEEAGSRFIIGSAESKSFGHGMTLQKVHGSEFARWQNVEDMWAGITQAVPIDSGEITLETTANGAYGQFYDLYQEAKVKPGQPWTTIFFRWMDDEQYKLECVGDEAKTIIGEVLRGEGEFGSEEQDLAQRLAAESVFLTAEQWKWRRFKRRELGQKFFEQYPEDDVSCFLASGRPFFDVAKVAKCKDGAVIAKHEADDLWIYEEPIAGRTYVLWADPAEGLERESGTDPTAWGILDAQTGEDVAVFLGYIAPSELARQIDKWGRVYNDALAAVERNNHGGTVLVLLGEERHAYPNIYHHSDRLKEDGEEDKRPGWPTNKITRPLMLDDLDMAIREGSYEPIDARMKQQMQAFHVNAKGRAEAKSGYHDDLVLGRAIGQQVRGKTNNVSVFGFL